MSYVMVPVPEEIGEQVRAFLGQLAFRDALANWDRDALVAFLADMSDPERQVVDVLVEAAEQAVPLTRRQLMAKLDISETDLDALLIELNRRAAASGNPWLIIVSKSEEVDQTPSTESIYVVRNVAAMIRDATS